MTIKYGILGCGEHALESHALPGKEIKNLELTTICDLSIERMNYFENKYGQKLEKFTNTDKLFSSEIDAIFIGTPDEFHFKNLQQAIKAKVHVFIEKPLATKTGEIEGLKKLIKTAEKNKLILTSCHPRRFDPPFEWLKDNIQQLVKELGKVNSLHFDFSYHKPSRQWKHDRGLLLDHANHEIDLLNFIFGTSSFEATRLKDTYDSYQIFGLREDEISFDFNGTRRLESHNYPEWVYIRFDRGDLSLDAHKGKVIINDPDKDSSKSVKVSPTNYELRGKKTMLNFVNAILKADNNYLTPEDLYVNTATAVMLTFNKHWSYRYKK